MRDQSKLSGNDLFDSHHSVPCVAGAAMSRTYLVKVYGAWGSLTTRVEVGAGDDAAALIRVLTQGGAHRIELEIVE